MSLQFPEELAERARREADSRSVPFARFLFRALAEYLDALEQADRTPVALKHGLYKKRVLGDQSAPTPPDPEDRRRSPRVKANFVDDSKKAG
jgi:hypothetical protein